MATILLSSQIWAYDMPWILARRTTVVSGNEQASPVLASLGAGGSAMPSAMVRHRIPCEIDKSRNCFVDLARDEL